VLFSLLEKGVATRDSFCTRKRLESAIVMLFSFVNYPYFTIESEDCQGYSIF